jgi:hypothetical protein
MQIFNIASTIKGCTIMSKPQPSRTLLRLIAFVLTIFNSFAIAQDPLQTQGFVSQGFIYTTDNQFQGDSQSGSLKLTELGFNLSKRFTPRLRLSTQLISRVANTDNDGNIKLDYLFLDYKAPISKKSQMGARLGRVKNVMGFYNETRDVAFTRPSIFSPQSIYFDLVRDLQLSSDGLIAYADWRAQNGTTLFELGKGKARIDSETEGSLIGTNIGEFIQEDVEQARLTYSLNDASTRFAFSRVDANLEHQMAPGFSTVMDVRLSLISAEYAREKTIFTAEYMELDVNYNSPVLSNITRPFLSWYFQIQHHYNTDWTFYSRYENFFLDANDKNGLELNITTGLPTYKAYTKSLMFGAKYQFNQDWMLMMELQDNNGTANLNPDINPNPFASKQHWQMLSLMLSYRF